MSNFYAPCFNRIDFVVILSYTILPCWNLLYLPYQFGFNVPNRYLKKTKTKIKTMSHDLSFYASLSDPLEVCWNNILIFNVNAYTF